VKTLVLWDIDGTLVDVKGAGRRSFIHGIEKAWGIVDDIADVKFGGATDLGVLAQLRARLHLPDEHTQAFFEHMTAHLEASLAPRVGDDGAAVCMGAVAVQGAVNAVHALYARGDVVQGLVTGNARSTAFVKLRAAGINTTPFVAGGYGDEHPDRNELARRALARISEQHATSRVVLIGDTPRDVEAAKTIGALAIAIARRTEDRAALNDARADHIVERIDEALALLEP
jgi:phosphoglycolate phosphatase